MFIMVVEDDAIVGLGIAMTIGDLGHTAIGPVRTVAEAFAELDRKPGVDLAILDYELKDGDAIRLANQLASRSIPYFWCSAHFPADIADTGPVVQKPFRVSDFRLAIEGMASAKTAVRLSMLG